MRSNASETSLRVTNVVVSADKKDSNWYELVRLTCLMSKATEFRFLAVVAQKVCSLVLLFMLMVVLHPLAAEFLETKKELISSPSLSSQSLTWS